METVMFWISERKLHQIAPEPSDPGGQIRTFSSLSPPQWPSYSPFHTKIGNLRPQYETFFLTLPSLTDVLSNKDSIVHYYDEFPWWLISAYNARDLGLLPGSERSPGEGNGNPLQYSCLWNLMDGEAWRATVCRIERVRHEWASEPAKLKIKNVPIRCQKFQLKTTGYIDNKFNNHFFKKGYWKANADPGSVWMMIDF